MTITYIPDFNLPIIDEEGRQKQEFNEWVREVSALLNEEVINEPPSYASGYWVNNTSPIVFVIQNGWLPAVGTLIENVSTADINVGTSNFTFNGTVATTFLISINSTVTKVGADTVDYEMGFFISTVVQPVTTAFTLPQDGEVTPSIHTILTMNPGDGVQPIFRFTNPPSGTPDIIVSSLNFTITSV